MNIPQQYIDDLLLHQDDDLDSGIEYYARLLSTDHLVFADASDYPHFFIHLMQTVFAEDSDGALYYAGRIRSIVLDNIKREIIKELEHARRA